MGNRKKGEGIHFRNFSSLSRFFLSSYCSSSSTSFFAENFCSTPFFLVLRCVSCVFTLAFYVFFGWLLMGVDHIIKNALLSWIHVYLLWNIKIWSCLRVYMKELRSAENRTHRVCMSSEFFGFNTDVFAFLWYFL